MGSRPVPSLWLEQLGKPMSFSALQLADIHANAQTEALVWFAGIHALYP